MSDLHDRLQFATQLARQAGDIMLQHFQIGLAKQDKADGSPVTIADKAINDLVIASVKKQYPKDGVRGEEGSYAEEGADYVWVCDPIDGTTPYIFGIPVSQFSLALVKNGEPLIGVLYDPYMKRMYQAVKGEGAFLNDKKVHVNDKKTLTNNFISVINQKVPLFDAIQLNGEITRRDIKACILYCFTAEAVMVANGQFVGNIFGYTTAHDVAAIKVIVEEAGGKVTDLFGNEQRYDQPISGAIVSNGVVHAELVALVKPFLKTS